MKLLRFTGTNVHGFLKFNIKFDSELTFLTGINGSGKTSVLNSIVALITPSLNTLAELSYSTVRVDFEHEGRKHFIQSDKSDQYIKITSSSSGENFIYNEFVFDGDAPLSKEAEFAQAYYSELSASHSQNPIIKFIAALPIPMFLGLDRRPRITDDTWRYRYPPHKLSGRAGRNVFSASLSRSLIDAAGLAERQYRDALIAAGRIGEELQREMLLRLLSVEPASVFGPLSRPTRADAQDITAVRRDIDALPQILNLPRREVRSKLLPFLDLLQGYMKEIDESDQLGIEAEKRQPNDPGFTALLNWSFNSPQLKRIRVVSEMVTTYNARRQKLTESTDRYLDLVNGFLGDSGKRVIFDDSGYISVLIEGVEGGKTISSLSSGEAQIFVILTHLAFNPLAQGANVFIIDEPELSLHVQWQELFVDSIRSANPTIQYILATHSPSIILEKIDSCVDISRKKMTRGNRG